MSETIKIMQPTITNFPIVQGERTTDLVSRFTKLDNEERENLLNEIKERIFLREQVVSSLKLILFYLKIIAIGITKYMFTEIQKITVLKSLRVVHL